MTDYLTNSKNKLIKSLLPDGDNYEVLLATTDAEIGEYERKGLLFVGRGLFEHTRFCAYLTLNKNIR